MANHLDVVRQRVCAEVADIVEGCLKLVQFKLNNIQNNTANLFGSLPEDALGILSKIEELQHGLNMLTNGPNNAPSVVSEPNTAPGFQPAQMMSGS